MAEGDSLEGDSLHGSSLYGAHTSLQFNNTRNLLDVVDSLRSHGISRYIDLPEIIVCGEQSSGKSSVLEAVSGVRFPSKDNLCTRFATELILRRGPVAPIKIRIVPGSQEERSEYEKDKLLNFNVSVSANDLQLGEIIESAKDAMGINDSTKVFSSDILRVELSGPEQPHLTLVDLPGLFQAGSRSQSDADSDTVKSLVLSYMRSPRSIILAVVSAKNDFNNQSITRYSREIDPKGVRTLGLITKPDTLDKGSDSERFYIELAQNKEVKFSLGWHVLRNRDYATRDSSSQERNHTEAQFFSSGVWRSLHTSHVGIHSLKPRLSKILKDHILAQLPDVVTQIQDGIRECSERLDVLGASRATAQEQRRYLLHVSHSFTSLVKAAIDGLYSDPFFGDASTTEGYQKRLRAVLQNQLTDFAKVIRTKGHKHVIVDEFGMLMLSRQISRSDYISKVKTLLERSRGRELPGTFDPLIIGQLFQEQCEPWAALVNNHMEKIVRAAYSVVRTALSHVSDHSTLVGLLRRFINDRFQILATELRDKVKEILRPHDTGHPITYNHYLTENVQKAQGKRRMREIKKSLGQVLGADYTDHGVVNIDINVNTLINTLVNKTEADMNNYASSTATDFMEAYYKVALKKVIDDFSVLAVEACLIQKLPTLFCPEDVLDINDATVAALASEDEEASAERAQCNEKLKVLEDGLKVLQDVQEYSLGFKEPATLQSVITGSAGLGGEDSKQLSTTDIDSENAIVERILESVP
ncbi:interferon-induced GTP-binding protein Mx [Lentithecium fluviatile CBS 122367]|uniref:Interferon-induced GTP-binding protein Mx n=1 Tax=Lentithecium fluviatile CBS 122367 TaxID=1168545 RepID=A0A6G1IDY1_9PLEO|nr:interferon-induced GTP-binding protein Mx [Lentithecium fluviatile CBS 122367]